MLDYEEIANIGRLKRLSAVNAEKDYLQNMVLLSIYSLVGDKLLFKGGTCLYKVYGLSRFSEDLDFTSVKKIDEQDMANKVIYDLKLFNIKGIIKETKKYRNEVNIKLLFNGPLYKGSKETQCFIPLNISLREKPVYDAKKQTIRPVYREIPDFDVFAMHEEEILAEKIRAIFTRNKARDVYDLWFLLKYRKLSINPDAADKKLKIYNLKFDREILICKIKAKKGLWNTDLKNIIIGELPDFDEVFEFITAKLKDL